MPQGSVLYSELKEQGYRGSERAVYRYLTYLRTQSWKKDLPSELLLALSSKRVTWLLVKDPSELAEEEQQELSLLRQMSVTADTTYRLVQAFGQMVRQRQGEEAEH